MLIILFLFFGFSNELNFTQPYYYINTTKNFFIGFTADKPIVVGPSVTFLAFVSCEIQDSLYFLGCHSPTGSAQSLSNATTLTSYMGHDFVIYNSEINDTIYYSGNCFTKTTKKILVRENLFNIFKVLTYGEQSSLILNLDFDASTDVSIISNDFEALTTLCIQSECGLSSILLKKVIVPTTTSTLKITSNEYALGDDRKTYRVGIFIDTNNATKLENLLYSSMPSSYNLAYPKFQRVARNLKELNPLIFGRVYDVLIREYDEGLIEECTNTCKERCDAESCLVDPTRINQTESGACFNEVLFDRLPFAFKNCPFENGTIYLFPTKYSNEVLTVFKSYNITKMYWRTTAGNVDPYATVYDKPQIHHNQYYLMSNPYEFYNHSINLEGDRIFFEHIKFVFQDPYEDPWFGAVLFSHNTSLTYNSVLKFHNCEFLGNSDDSVLFNSLQVNGQISSITFQFCSFFGVVYEFTPDTLDVLYFTNNDISFDGTSSRGVLDLEIYDYFEITDNHGIGLIRFNTICNGITCIKDSPCYYGGCKFDNNNFTGIPITTIDSTVYNFDNVGITIDNINSNVATNDDYGLGYTNMPYIECNYTNLKKIIIRNMELTGFIDAVVCDLDETTEKSCSWPCIGERPPPKNCTIDPSVTVSHIDYLYSLFPTIEDALDYCLSEPVQHIVLIYPGNYIESNLLFQPADVDTQTGLRMESTVSGVNIIGTNHLFLESYNYIEFYDLNFYSQLFTGPTATPLSAVFHIFRGSVKNLKMENVIIQSVPSPDNQPSDGSNYPDVDNLLDIELAISGYVWTSLELIDVGLYGSKVASVLIDDLYVNDPYNSSYIRFENVEGKANQQAFIELQGVGELFFENVTCTMWCGKFTSMTSAVRITNKEVFDVTNKLFFEINGLQIGVTNPIVQSAEDNGVGYITALWIDNPTLLNSSLVETFKIRRLESLNYPIGLRYIDISENVLQLNEDPLSYPIAYDSKRGMRETARYNTIEGTKHDVRNSNFPLDGSDPSHTCDDLCLPSDGEVCEVNDNYDDMFDGWGARRFATVQTAIEHCVSTTLPMPVKLVLDPGDPGILINKEHIENVYFNSTKDIKFFGTISSSGTSRIVIVGRHAIATGQTGKLFIEELEFLIDDSRVPDRSKPLFVLDNPTGTINYQMKFADLILSTDLDPLNSGVIDAKVSSTLMEFNNVVIEKGFFTSKGVIDLQTYSTDVLFSGLVVEHSDGPALDIRNADGRIGITKSTFEKCGMAATIAQNSCIYIDSSNGVGTIHTSESLITRSGAIIKSNESGLYFSGLLYKTDIDVYDVSQSTTLKNIKSWTMNTNIPIGIRITGVNFTGHILTLSPKGQKLFVRKISTNNLGIVSTFHDIVINERDNEIAADPDNNERYFCSDACQFRSSEFSSTFTYVGVGAGVAVLIVLIIVFTFPLGFLITGRIKHFKIRDVKIRLRRVKKRE
jgi:hypothetical protein